MSKNKSLSVKKRERQNRKRRLHNLKYKKWIKSLMKKIKKSTDAAEKKELLNRLYEAIDKAAKRNIIHRNKAARLKSKYARLVNDHEKADEA